MNSQAPGHSWQQLVVSPKVERMGDGRNRPFVGIGVALAKFGGWGEHDEQWQRLKARIGDLGEEAWHGPTFGSRRCEILVTKPLDELFSDEVTLDRQAERITQWALAQREVLLAIDSN